MPSSRSLPRRQAALSAGVAVALATGLAVVAAPAPSQAVATQGVEAADPLSSVGKKLLTVGFDAQATTIDRGDQFSVSGTVSKVTQAEVGQLGAVVAGTFTLQVTDATGRVLGSQKVTSAADGTFSSTVPGSLTGKLPASSDDLHLAVRAVSAKAAGGYAATYAGAAPVVVRGKATGLRITDSFVSSVGWVKPGDKYPSSILVSNPTGKAISGAVVTIKAPKGSTIVKASGSGRHPITKGRTIIWRLKPVPAAKSGKPGTARLVLESRAASVAKLATVVWRDLSTTAVLKSKRKTSRVASHGPKVIPPSGNFDTARYGDRPFPIIPVQYLDRSYQANHSGASLERTINSKSFAGSTFNLYQEMSLKQLYPNGTVPSAGISTAGFDYAPGFDFTQIDPATANTCHGVTTGSSAVGTPLYPDRITDGVYNLPGSTEYYGSDSNGSAVVGSVAGVAALQSIDGGCGPSGKIVADAVAIADPELDYSDYDTDKDGVVDFFMAVFAGCGGNGASQIPACAPGSSNLASYDNIWPNSSSLEYYYTDPTTGLPGITTDDQLKNLEGKPLYYTSKSRKAMTTRKTAYKVFVRVGPYNLNPETALDKASVISHEYGHSLGLPDFYSTGGRETYGDWNLMATDKSQNMDAFSRQELGWVVPQVLPRGTYTKTKWTDSKQDIHRIVWKTKGGKAYTLKAGKDGKVHNSLMYVAKLPGRELINSKVFDTGQKASKKRAWFSGAGNDFGCNTDGGGHNLDFSVPALSKLPAGSTVNLSFKSNWDIEWDYDYGFVLTSKNGGGSFTSHASENGYTTSNSDPTAANPNQNACQGAYDNGITGTSASYDAGTQATDRKLGNTPAGIFLEDSYDISDLVRAKTPVIRFSYATDPGLARPGWFIDDLKVTATTPSGKKVLLSTNFEKTGGPDDPAVFNGGCKTDGPGGKCTPGWQYVTAGDKAAFDHAYYLEMRDRSGFDKDGKGQIDRDPIGWGAGLYLGYTDEAHGYGNAGTDDPPAQSPIDATPTPGSTTPNLNDASFTTQKGRTSFTDFGVGHTDNYSDPANTSHDPRYADVDNPWRFQYGCLAFTVRKMSGTGVGPSKSNGDLTGAVKFKIGSGCGAFDYGYDKTNRTIKNTKPLAKIAVKPATKRVVAGQRVQFSAGASTDKQTPKLLSFSWNFFDGGRTKDATTQTVGHKFGKLGRHKVRLTVTDPGGLKAFKIVYVTVVNKP